MAIPITNIFMKRSTEMNQGIYDLMFGSYYVKHVPTKEDKSGTGWMAKFESMGDYGEKFQANREKKAAQKAEAAAKSPEAAEKKAAEEEAAAAEKKKSNWMKKQNSDD